MSQALSPSIHAPHYGAFCERSSVGLIAVVCPSWPSRVMHSVEVFHLSLLGESSVASNELEIDERYVFFIITIGFNQYLRRDIQSDSREGARRRIRESPAGEIVHSAKPVPTVYLANCFFIWSSASSHSNGVCVRRFTKASRSSLKSAAAVSCVPDDPELAELGAARPHYVLLAIIIGMTITASVSKSFQTRA